MDPGSSGESRQESPRYSPLQDGRIRLLELAPTTEENSPIACKLSTVSPSQSPDYEALSYVWGDTIHYGQPLLLGGIAVWVTDNLALALRSLRRPSSWRTLWVDALCINQDDPQERCQQVDMMGHIYREASGVVIFLGGGWDGQEIAWEYLDLAADRADAHFKPSLQPCLRVSHTYHHKSGRFASISV